MVSNHDKYKEEHCRITGEICEYGSCVECEHGRDEVETEGYRDDL